MNVAMQMYFRLAFLISVLAFYMLGNFSCTNSRISKLNEKENAYVGKIILSAGDDLNYETKEPLGFMAFPMNVAILKNSKDQEKLVYIVGKAINRETSVSFRPLALINFADENNKIKQVAVGRPINEKWITSEINDYNELLSIHYGVKQVLEAWLRNMYGYGSVSNIKWENETKAKEFLDL